MDVSTLDTLLRPYDRGTPARDAERKADAGFADALKDQAAHRDRAEDPVPRRAERPAARRPEASSADDRRPVAAARDAIRTDDRVADAAVADDAAPAPVQAAGDTATEASADLADAPQIPTATAPVAPPPQPVPVPAQPAAGDAIAIGGEVPAQAGAAVPADVAAPAQAQTGAGTPDILQPAGATAAAPAASAPAVPTVPTAGEAAAQTAVAPTAPAMPAQAAAEPAAQDGEPAETGARTADGTQAATAKPVLGADTQGRGQGQSQGQNQSQQQAAAGGQAEAAKATGSTVATTATAVQADPLAAQAAAPRSDMLPTAFTLPSHQAASAAAPVSGETLLTASRAGAMPMPASEQVVLRLHKAAADGNDRISMSLKPAELGRVDIQLDVGPDGRVHAIVSADRPETLSLLQRDARGLQEALQNAGFQADGGDLSFNLRQQSRDGHGADHAGQGAGGPDVADAGESESPTPPPRTVRVGGIDLTV